MAEEIKIEAGRTYRDDPHADVIVAIIMLALFDLKSRKKDERTDAQAYLASPSFDWHCKLIGLEPNYLRKGIA